jgi:hypothetical protein
MDFSTIFQIDPFDSLYCLPISSYCFDSYRASQRAKATRPRHFTILHGFAKQSTSRSGNGVSAEVMRPVTV